MKINSMDEFQKICREKLIEWYYLSYATYEDTSIVWSIEALQNYKCVVSLVPTNKIVRVYAEFTYNRDKEVLYMDVYRKGYK